MNKTAKCALGTVAVVGTGMTVVSLLKKALKAERDAATSRGALIRLLTTIDIEHTHLFSAGLDTDDEIASANTLASLYNDFVKDNYELLNKAGVPESITSVELASFQSAGGSNT